MSTATARVLADPLEGVRGPLQLRGKCRHRGQFTQSFTWKLRRRRVPVLPAAATSATGVINKIGAGSWTCDGTAAGPGAHRTEHGVNFVLETPADEVTLCLFTWEDLQQGTVSGQVRLDPSQHRTGDVWHVFLEDLPDDILYGYSLSGPNGEIIDHMPAESAVNKASEDGENGNNEQVSRLPLQTFDPEKIVLDPYARAVVSRTSYGVPAEEGDCWPQMASPVPALEDNFDWMGDRPLGYDLKDLIIYEVSVRGFTQDPSSGVKHPGTYLGMVERLDDLKAMGINAIELLPIFEFNELENYSLNPATKEYRVNFWGYSTVAFFAPMARYATNGGAGNYGRDTIREFKTLVRECHRRGIEVILDVVFNHTAEGNELGPTLSFKGLNNQAYYMLAPLGQYYNYSGCGNTFNCNHPIARNFIINCLRYWVQEMHVDGFRFDLAAIMVRCSNNWEHENVFGRNSPATSEATMVMGHPLDVPPLIEMISNDPVLSSVKLIAEAWDAGGLYLVGKFPHSGIWAEWNGKYRDVVRQFIKGTDGQAGDFADCICGSPTLYRNGRTPGHSINFITAHDGFTLHDLVSYNDKHNEANGEDNRDGENHNNSWNCGVEGQVDNPPKHVQALRQRQMRNYMVALMVSQGVPMVHMGDEYGHSKKGNNNTYCHDNKLNYIDWDLSDRDPQKLRRFFSKLTKLRSSMPQLRLEHFPEGDVIEWHGIQAGAADFGYHSRFLAFCWKGRGKSDDLYVAFNSSHVTMTITVPHPPHGCVWTTVVDTARLPPFDFIDEDLDPEVFKAVNATLAAFLESFQYPMLSYTAVILRAKPIK